MREAKVAPTQKTYTSLIAMYVQKNHLTLASRTLYTMLKEGFSPAPQSFFEVIGLGTSLFHLFLSFPRLSTCFPTPFSHCFDVLRIPLEVILGLTFAPPSWGFLPSLSHYPFLIFDLW